MSQLLIENALPVPSMNSFLGAWGGLLNSLADPRPLSELWGVSAWAFQTHVHKSLLAEGLLPRNWDEVLPAVALRTGYACEAGLRDFFYTQDDLRQIQIAWLKTVEKAMQDGRPALSFGIGGPVFGTLFGFDDETENYTVASPLTPPDGTLLNALELGSLQPPLIFVLIPTGPLGAYDRAQAARAALNLAVDHHLGVEKDAAGRRLDYGSALVAGPGAFNAWSNAIETGAVAQHWTLALHAAYYAEARTAGAAWLRDIRDILGATAVTHLDAARTHLLNQAQCLTHLGTLFPMAVPESFQDSGKRSDASAALRLARAEHVAAMEAIMTALESGGEPPRQPLI